MNIRSVLLVALALLPFLITDGISAAPASWAPTEPATVRPAVYWASSAHLVRGCTQIVRMEPRSPSRQTPDTIADCRVSSRTRGWTMTDFPAAPFWEARHEVVF